MRRFAKKIMPKCKWATRNVSEQEKKKEKKTSQGTIPPQVIAFSPRCSDALFTHFQW